MLVHDPMNRFLNFFRRHCFGMFGRFQQVLGHRLHFSAEDILEQVSSGRVDARRERKVLTMSASPASPFSSRDEWEEPFSAMGASFSIAGQGQSSGQGDNLRGPKEGWAH